LERSKRPLFPCFAIALHIPGRFFVSFSEKKRAAQSGLSARKKEKNALSFSGRPSVARLAAASNRNGPQFFHFQRPQIAIGN
jgi:hypothetical protein